jgi:hypothetical protein
MQAVLEDQVVPPLAELELIRFTQLLVSTEVPEAARVVVERRSVVTSIRTSACQRRLAGREVMHSNQE